MNQLETSQLIEVYQHILTALSPTPSARDKRARLHIQTEIKRLSASLLEPLGAIS